MAITPLPDVPRGILARTFTDPQILDAMESILRNTAAGVPEAVNEAQTTADDAQTTADAAAAAASTIAASEIVVTAASGALTAERVLTGGTGVSLNVGTPGIVEVIVNVLAILGYTPANKAGDTFTGAVDVQALLQCNDLRVDQTPAATATASTHSIPINCNGVTYYMRLSSAP